VPTLWDPVVRQALLERTSRLRADAKPKWGTLTAPGMVEHLVLWFRYPAGELEAAMADVPAVLRWFPVKQLFTYVLPVPKGIETVPELVPAAPRSLDAALADLRAVLGRLAAKPAAGPWPDHYAFGPYSRRAWGVLGWKHTDYHLRQFEV
jgi:hypothetical protein